LFLWAINDTIQRRESVPDEHDLESIVAAIQQALADGPEEAALIQHNIKMLRARCEPNWERHAA
jgi:hypothetical protein